MFGRLRCRGQHRDLLRCIEPVPAALWHDDECPGRHLDRLRAVVGDDGQRGGAAEDVHDLVARRMYFPTAVTFERPDEDAAVAERREGRECRVHLGFGGVGAAAPQRGQPGERLADVDCFQNHVECSRGRLGWTS